MSSPSGTNYQSVTIAGAWRQKDVGSAKRCVRWTRGIFSLNDIPAAAYSIVGSNDQTTWYLLDRVSNQNTTSLNRTVDPNYSQYSYRYYRWIEEAKVSGSSNILNHWFGMFDQNNVQLTTDGSFTASNGAGDVAGNSSTTFIIDSANGTNGTFNWQGTSNYGSGTYSGPTSTLVYDPTLPILPTPVLGEWIQFDLGTAKVISTYGLGNGGSDKEIGNWTLAGSTDNSTWYTIDTQTEPTPAHYSFDNYTTAGPAAAGGFRYIRLIIQGLRQQPYIMGTTVQFILYLRDSGGNFLQTSPVNTGTFSQNLGNTTGYFYLSSSTSDTSNMNIPGAGPNQPGYYYGTNDTYTGTVSTSITSGALPPSAPSAPTSLSASAAGSGSVSISFTQASNGGSVITNYKYSLNGGTTFTAFNPADTASPVVIGGLTTGIAYMIQLKAVNSIGDSDASATVSPPPTTVGELGSTATFDLGASYQLGSYGYCAGSYSNSIQPAAWKMAGSNDNSTWYLVDSVSNGNSGSGDARSFTPSGPSRVSSFRYYRWILQRSGDGAGNTYSGGFFLKNTSGSVITATVIQNNIATYYGGYLNLNLMINRTSFIGGAETALYPSYTPSYTGSNSTTLIIDVPPSAPPAPTSLAASAGNESASISFTQTSNGGFAIENYLYSLNGGSSFTAFNPVDTASPVVISGLTNGVSYTIQLKGANSLGEGDASASITVTPATIPDAPTNLVATYAGSGTVEISFTPGSNGGSTIINYQYSTDCGVSFSPLDPTDGTTPITIGGLTNGQAYCIELKAENSINAGIASSSVQYTPYGPADAPTSLTWVDTLNGTISLSFTQGSNQGSAITNYEYSLDGGNTFAAFSPAQTSSPVSISGLNIRTHYSIVLRAVNDAGSGTDSATLNMYYMCFLEGTKILCFNPETNKEEYRAIETLRKGSLVKTVDDGYKAIDMIGTSKIYNPGNSVRSKNRLYKCSKENYPSLTEDLFITGCHSILVKDISEAERAELMEFQGKIYITDNHYRLIAAVDKRAEPHACEGVFNIWHMALENESYYFNYGIYANGLLVETSSLRMMKEISGMDLVQ